jgi:hypothetical protein
MTIKKYLIFIFLLISINGYSQSFYDLLIRNNLTVNNQIELGDSSAIAIATNGDTIATIPWVTKNAAILTGNNTEIYYKYNNILSSTPLFTYNPLDKTLTVDSLLLTNGQKISWNSDKSTINIPSEYGSIIQAGQELQIKIYNNSGSLIPNGKAVYPNGNFNGFGTIGLAKASTHDSLGVDYGLTTVDIDNNNYGMVVWFGEARNLNTSSFSVGDTIYISPNTPGELTKTRPSFPDYAIQIGIVTVSDASDGVIFVTSRTTKENTFANFHNGTFRETFDFRITESGGVITGTLTPSDGHPNMTMLFSDGFTTLDTDPGATVTLTAGTDINPQANYVYIPQSTKVLTVSTSGFPANEHIKVASVVLQSASTTGTLGALRNQNWNDAIQSTSTNQGHLSHIGERIRQFGASWDNGTEGSISTGDLPTNVYVQVTAGEVYQMHKQTFPAQDMSTGDDIFIVNDPVTAYRNTTNLNTITDDASGNSINNQYTPLVIWGIANKTGEESHIMCNLPSGTYNSEENAIADINGYTVYDIPNEFKGVGFLIAKFIVRKSSSTWTYNPSTGYLNLCGKVPNTTAGAGTGSSGVTTFLGLTDTESSYTAYEFQVANAGATALESPPELTLNDSLKLSSGNLIINDTIKARIVTLDSIAARNDSIYMRSPVKLNSELNYQRTRQFFSGLDVTAVDTINHKEISLVIDNELMGVTPFTANKGVYTIEENGGINAGQLSFYMDRNTVHNYNDSISKLYGLEISVTNMKGSVGNDLRNFIGSHTYTYNSDSAFTNLSTALWLSSKIKAFGATGEVYVPNGQVLLSKTTIGNAGKTEVDTMINGYFLSEISSDVGGTTRINELFNMKSEVNRDITGGTFDIDNIYGLYLKRNDVSGSVNDYGIVEDFGENVFNSETSFDNLIYLNKYKNAWINRDSVNTSLYIGDSVGFKTITGALRNTASGFYAFKDNVSGDNNTAMGFAAGQMLETESNNTFIGAYAGNSVKGGANTFIGMNCGRLATNSTLLTGIGQSALFRDTSGYNTVAIGNSALNSDYNSIGNVAIGVLSGRNNSGDSVVLIGFESGYENTGDGVILIGNRAGYNNTLDDRLMIDNSSSDDPLIDGYFELDSMDINGSLNIVGNLYVNGNPIQDAISSSILIAKAEVLYTNTSQTTIVTLPVNAVIWDISIEVATTFNGSGADILEVGVTSTSDKYYVSSSVLLSTAFSNDLGTGIPERFTSGTNITFKYTDGNSDASQGQAFVYIHYSLH